MFAFMRIYTREKVYRGRVLTYSIPSGRVGDSQACNLGNTYPQKDPGFETTVPEDFQDRKRTSRRTSNAMKSRANEFLRSRAITRLVIKLLNRGRDRRKLSANETSFRKVFTFRAGESCF